MKVSDLHESAAALDMIGDSTKRILRKNVLVVKWQLQMAGQKELQVGNTVGYLFSCNRDSQCDIKIGAHYILRNNTETKAHLFCFS